MFAKNEGCRLNMSRQFLLYLWSEVSRDPQRKLCSCRVLSEVKQARRVSVVQRRGLAIISHWRMAIVHRRLPIVGERRMAEVRFDILSRFYL